MKQTKQKQGHDRGSKFRCFQKGDKVFVQNAISQVKWSQGEVLDRIGQNMYVVRLVTGQDRRYHADQLRHRACEDRQCANQTNPNKEDQQVTVTSLVAPHGQSS